MGGLRRHLPGEVLTDRGLVLESEEPEQVLVGGVPLGANEVLEHDDAKAIGRDAVAGAVLLAAHAPLDRPQPLGPPIDRRRDPVGAPGLAGHRGGRIAAVAKRVQNDRFGEQPQERLGLLDVVRGHLDQPRLAGPLSHRSQQIQEEPAAGPDRVIRVVRLEALAGAIEVPAAGEVVEAAGTPVDANPVPPEAAQLREVGGKRHPALEQVADAALVAVEPRLDRNVGKPRMVSQQAGERVSPRAPGPADEDELSRAVHAGCRS
jgi:hypothetical protein